MSEEWRQFMTGYEVSNLGRVRRSTDGRRTHTGRLLRPVIMRVGYYCVRPVVGGKNKHVYVHDAVASVFIGTKPDGSSVNHKDGNKKNNAAMNLEYVTHAENMRHASDIGLLARGVRHPQSKLTDDSVRSLREDRMCGISFARIARKYGISISTAFNASRGNNWSHVS